MFGMFPSSIDKKVERECPTQLFCHVHTHNVHSLKSARSMSAMACNSDHNVCSFVGSVVEAFLTWCADKSI